MKKHSDRRIVLFGGGGHALVVIDACKAMGYEPVAVFDEEKTGATVGDVPVVGSDAEALSYFRRGVNYAVVTTVGNITLREKLTEYALGIGYKIPTMHNCPQFVSPSAVLGEGSTILPGSMVGAESVLGRYVTVNTMATIEHQSRIGDYTHVAPHAAVLGMCTVGRSCLIGAGSVLLPGVFVGDYCTIGAGAVVLNDVLSGSTVVGNPARVIG